LRGFEWLVNFTYRLSQSEALKTFSVLPRKKLGVNLGINRGKNPPILTLLCSIEASDILPKVLGHPFHKNGSNQEFYEKEAKHKSF
jgi:hypothetical protein